MMPKFAHWLAYKLAQKTDRNDVDYIRYGIEVTFSLVLKIVIFVIIGLVFNILGELFLIILAFVTYRIITGGVHMSTFLRCLISSIILFTVPAYFLKDRILVISPNYFIAFAFLLSILVIYLYVPVEATNRPIPAEKRKLFKWLSLIYLIFWLSINLLILYFLDFFPYLKISYFTSIGLIIQNMTLIPIGYKILHTIDQFFQKQSKELEVNVNEKGI